MNPHASWECHKCKTVYAPFVPSCQKCSGQYKEKPKLSMKQARDLIEPTKRSLDWQSNDGS